MKRSILLLAALTLLPPIGGCFGPKTPPGMPKLEPTTITITQDSVPLANATLNIKPVEPSTTNNFTCGGTTDEKGVATIVTHGQFKGIPAGKYKVAVSCTIGEGTPPPPSPIDEESARKWKEYKDSGATYEEFYVVDPQYGTIEKTPLEIEIVKGKNNLTLDCGAAVKVPVEKSQGAAGVL